MTLEQIREDVARIAAHILSWQGELPVGPLVEILDSVQLVTLAVAVEDHFHIILEPEDEEQIVTLADLIEVIAKKLSGSLS